MATTVLSTRCQMPTLGTQPTFPFFAPQHFHRHLRRAAVPDSKLWYTMTTPEVATATICLQYPTSTATVRILSDSNHAIHLKTILYGSSFQTPRATISYIIRDGEVLGIDWTSTALNHLCASCGWAPQARYTTTSAGFL